MSARVGRRGFIFAGTMDGRRLIIFLMLMVISAKIISPFRDISPVFRATRRARQFIFSRRVVGKLGYYGFMFSLRWRLNGRSFTVMARPPCHRRVWHVGFAPPRSIHGAAAVAFDFAHSSFAAGPEK